jgi:hypothetical protein
MIRVAARLKLDSKRRITVAGVTTAIVRRDGSSSFSYLSIDGSCCKKLFGKVGNKEYVRRTRTDKEAISGLIS